MKLTQHAQVRMQQRGMRLTRWNVSCATDARNTTITAAGCCIDRKALRGSHGQVRRADGRSLGPFVCRGGWRWGSADSRAPNPAPLAALRLHA